MLSILLDHIFGAFTPLLALDRCEHLGLQVQGTGRRWSRDCRGLFIGRRLARIHIWLDKCLVSFFVLKIFDDDSICSGSRQDSMVAQ